MAAKSESIETSKESIITVFYRPEKEIPSRSGPMFFDLNTSAKTYGQQNYLRLTPGRNKVEVDKWQQVRSLELGQKLLKLGVLQEVASAEKPIGERPGVEALKNLPVESAISWVEFEQSDFVLRAWQADDFRDSIQKAIQQRIIELKQNMI